MGNGVKTHTPGFTPLKGGGVSLSPDPLLEGASSPLRVKKYGGQGTGGGGERKGMHLRRSR